VTGVPQAAAAVSVLSAVSPPMPLRAV